MKIGFGQVGAVALAATLALSGCASSYYGSEAPRTQLSQCTRNALIGAGLGALIGVAQDSSGQRGENAALGAVIGGAATYGACKLLTARDQQRVEGAYQSSLESGAPVNQSWQSDDGGTRNLAVAAPQPAPGRPQCQSISATISDGSGAVQQLPPETFCQNAYGQWVPS